MAGVAENVGIRKNGFDGEWTAHPGGPGEPQNVTGGASPGRLRPPEGPDALGAVRRKTPAWEKG